jgi:hypothetical protein
VIKPVEKLRVLTIYTVSECIVVSLYVIYYNRTYWDSHICHYSEFGKALYIILFFSFVTTALFSLTGIMRSLKLGDNKNLLFFSVCLLLSIAAVIPVLSLTYINENC